MPSKKTKQQHMSPQDVSASLAEEKEQQIDKECASEVEAVLLKHGRALQPFMSRSEFGDSPRVRLVRMAAPQETDTDVEASA